MRKTHYLIITNKLVLGKKAFLKNIKQTYHPFRYIIADGELDPEQEKNEIQSPEGPTVSYVTLSSSLRWNIRLLCVVEMTPIAGDDSEDRI